YDLLVGDLVAVMDAVGAGRALVAGHSMGAHTALRLALERPERVAALGLITPAYDPERHPLEDDVRETERLIEGLRRDGAQGFARGLRPLADESATRAMRSLIRQ